MIEDIDIMVKVVKRLTVGVECIGNDGEKAMDGTTKSKR